MDDLGPFMIASLIFAIPVIAVVGGVVHGIVRTVNRQRMLELAQKERIAAIERGIDPKSLPQLVDLASHQLDPGMSFEQQQLRRSQATAMGGMITLAIGLALLAAGAIVENKELWIPALVMSFIGVALLISARMFRSNGSRSA